MRKARHSFKVYGTDDHQVSDFTRWMRLHAFATRREAWERAKMAKIDGGYRHVKIIEERIFSA